MKKISSIKDLSRKCDQVHRKLQIWSNLLKKSVMENFIFCTVQLPLLRDTSQLGAPENLHDQLYAIFVKTLLNFVTKSRS